jgi:hypothetical protein
MFDADGIPHYLGSGGPDSDLADLRAAVERARRRD